MGYFVEHMIGIEQGTAAAGSSGIEHGTQPVHSSR